MDRKVFATAYEQRAAE